MVITTTIDVCDDAGFNIGFIQQITRTDSRPTTPIRHLDSSDAGRMLEQAPGVESNLLGVSGYALYNIGTDKRSLLNRLGGTTSSKFRSLNSQYIPVEITERWTHPSTKAPAETLYGDCYLTNYSRPINLTTAVIVETASITCTWIE